MTLRILLTASLLLAGCGSSPDDDGAGDTTSGGATTDDGYRRLDRLRFNQMAVLTNTPIFWASDADGDGEVDADELRALRFYPVTPPLVQDGELTEAFAAAYEAMVEADRAGAPSDPRRAAIHQELTTTAPTLLDNDLTELPADHQAFARHMLRVADLIDQLFARQVGMTRLADQVADDAPSQSLFRRNWGPRCLSANTESNEACSAIEGAPDQTVDVYPQALQSDEGFCEALEGRDDSAELLTPFTVVREREGELVAVPYTEAYAEPMSAIAAELRAAADALTDEDEDALRAYLRAAAQAYTDNDWNPADEAWAAMNVRNSAWYVRVAPDEVYWDPCSQHAGFHLTLALINRGSLEWQDRLTPLQQRMEESVAELSEDYEPRDVSFHLPDFIDIVVNAGDDRSPFGATIGQSLPNWGPVSEEGRGRTVAMTNLYTDPDSAARRRMLAESLFTAETLAHYTEGPQAGLLSTILHEATHNLGPSHEYAVDGETDDEVFGGQMASMLEELKAQSGALFYVQLLRDEEILDADEQREVYLDSIVWAMGHISRGMYSASGRRKPYSQLAAVQVGFLMENGALRWDPEATAANGEDQGAFSIDYDAFPGAARELMTLVMGIKASGDREEAERIATRWVDGDVVPQETIRERWNRAPHATFVYSVTL